MLNKKLFLLFILILSIFNIGASKYDSLTVEGSIDNITINQDINLNLNVTKGLLNEVILLTIYEDDSILIENKEYVAHYLKKQPICLTKFETFNKKRNIKIVINYRSIIVSPSMIEFDIFSPTFKDNIIEIDDSNYFKNENPVGVNFKMYKSSKQINYIYESIDINRSALIDLNKNRIVDMSMFEFKIDSKKNHNISFVELRIYEEFIHSDLIYKDNMYMVIDLPVKKISDNHFKISNDYLYYIDENNGGIYINHSNTTNKDITALFIPFSIKENKIIDYEIAIYDVGNNHDSYIVKGKFFVNYMGQLDEFSYKLVDEPLEGITYE